LASLVAALTSSHTELTVAQMLDSLGVEELPRLWEQARRLIHDNNVTYNVYGDPQGMHRLWELDAVPLGDVVPVPA
jgi:uncharacterized circularly permuted ATP-grasp superfamily protein